LISFRRILKASENSLISVVVVALFFPSKTSGAEVLLVATCSLMGYGFSVVMLLMFSEKGLSVCVVVSSSIRSGPSVVVLIADFVGKELYVCVVVLLLLFSSSTGIRF
jgi:hypothetical protein